MILRIVLFSQLSYFEPLLEKMRGTSSKLLWGSIICVALYVVAMFCPDCWWGLHFLAFVPPVWKYGLLVLSLAFIFIPIIIKETFQIHFIEKSFNWNILSIALALAMGWIFLQFPIYMDNYGDATFVKNSQDEVIQDIPRYMKEELTLFTFHPSHCRIFMLGWIYSLGETFQLTYREIYTYVNLISGVFWVLLWLSMVGRYLKNSLWKIGLGLLGISAPFMANYFGHLEVYGPLCVLFLLYLFALLEYLRSKNTALLISLVILQILLLRMHPLAWFFIPALVMGILNNYQKQKFISKLLTWKGVLLGVYLPFIILTISLYILTEDYKDDRIIYGTVAGDHIFLPILSPAPPLDRYNLFSFNHIFDFGNMLLFLSAPTWVLLIELWRKRDSSISQLPVLIVSITLLLFLTFLFTLNPLLSLPMDWDLFALAAPVLLVLVLLKATQVQEKAILAFQSMSSIIGLSLLSLPFFWINGNKQPYSERLESIGIRVYKTYYEWSGQQLDFALWLNKDEPNKYLDRQEKLTGKLKPYALPAKDIQYAHLLSIYGNSVLQYTSDKEKARLLFREAHYFSAEHKVNLLRLYKVNFALGRYKEAYDNSLELMEMRYPSEKEAMEMMKESASKLGLNKETDS